MGEYLDDFLRRNKKDKATISKSLFANLEKVEAEILARKNAIFRSNEEIKNNAINFTNISNSTGISRKTFYNNELLNKIVSENIVNENDSKEEIKKLKEKLEDTESKLLKLIKKDLQLETLKNEIKKIQSELEYANKRVKSLEKQHEEDLLKMKQTVSKTNIVLN